MNNCGGKKEHLKENRRKTLFRSVSKHTINISEKTCIGTFGNPGCNPSLFCWDQQNMIICVNKCASFGWFPSLLCCVVLEQVWEEKKKDELAAAEVHSNLQWNVFMVYFGWWKILTFRQLISLFHSCEFVNTISQSNIIYLLCLYKE